MHVACKDEIDGADLREDGLHFKGAGARAVNNWLIPQVTALAQSMKATTPGG